MMMKRLPPMPQGNTSGLSAKLIAILRAGSHFLKQCCYLYSWWILTRSAKLSKILLSISGSRLHSWTNFCYHSPLSTTLLPQRHFF